MLTTIKSISKLIELASREQGLECFITLNYGVKSSKFITYDKTKKKPFHILNLIDDSNLRVTEKELSNKNITLIGEAISKGALIAEN